MVPDQRVPGTPEEVYTAKQQLDRLQKHIEQGDGISVPLVTANFTNGSGSNTITRSIVEHTIAVLTAGGAGVRSRWGGKDLQPNTNIYYNSTGASRPG